MMINRKNTKKGKKSEKRDRLEIQREIEKQHWACLSDPKDLVNH